MHMIRDLGLIGISATALQAMRASLEETLGDDAAPVLQQVGFASGDEMYEAFAQWLEEDRGIERPDELEALHLSDALSSFFYAVGWGTVTVERMGAAALTIDAPAWAEASSSQDAAVPSCHITTGLLAGFLGRLAEDVVAVMEVECRTAGHDHCRFLVGSPETLQAVFERMSEGTDYEEALTTASGAT